MCSENNYNEKNALNVGTNAATSERGRSNGKEKKEVS